MHDCCWSASPSFEIARILLIKDPTFLFLQDVRGALPLSYVTKSNWVRVALVVVRYAVQTNTSWYLFVPIFGW